MLRKCMMDGSSCLDRRVGRCPPEPAVAALSSRGE
jgi:hypothetical protein